MSIIDKILELDYKKIDSLNFPEFNHYKNEETSKVLKLLETFDPEKEKLKIDLSKAKSENFLRKQIHRNNSSYDLEKMSEQIINLFTIDHEEYERIGCEDVQKLKNIADKLKKLCKRIIQKDGGIVIMGTRRGNAFINISAAAFNLDRIIDNQIPASVINTKIQVILEREKNISQEKLEKLETQVTKFIKYHTPDPMYNSVLHHRSSKSLLETLKKSKSDPVITQAK